MAYANIPTLTDWQYDESIKKIKHNTGTTRVTCNALYSALMDLADDAGFMDSTIPMSAQTPTEYTLINGWTFNADGDLDYLYGGSVVVQKATTDRDVWANFYTLGTIEADAIVYWMQNAVLIAALGGTAYTYTSGHADQLIKVVAAGANVSTDGTALAVTAFVRNNASGNADLYDHFSAVATATGGRNPVPLSSGPDSSDDGTGAAVAAALTLTFGTSGQDIGDGAGSQNYDVVVNGAGYTATQVYRALKYLTRRENTTAIGTGVTIAGRFYRAADKARGTGTSYPEVKVAPFGTLAGGVFYGARGVYLTNISDANNRSLIDSAGVTRNPPVTMSASVTGMAIGDRALVARSTSGVLIPNQFTLNGTHTTATSIVVNETVTADIPSTGVIRVGDTRYTYGALNRGTKTFSSLSATATHAAASPAYVPLIDDVVSSGTSLVSPSMTYFADFEVVVRVRKKGIQPFENTMTVSTTGASMSTIRTVDTIAT